MYMTRNKKLKFILINSPQITKNPPKNIIINSPPEFFLNPILTFHPKFKKYLILIYPHQKRKKIQF